VHESLNSLLQPKKVGARGKTSLTKAVSPVWGGGSGIEKNRENGGRENEGKKGHGRKETGKNLDC